MNIVATHAYIEDHSGIVPHTCSATSMCALHTQVSGGNSKCVAMDTNGHGGVPCESFIQCQTMKKRAYESLNL